MSYDYCHTSERPATDTLGRRVVVRFQGGHEVAVAWCYAWTGTQEDSHRAAVTKAIKDLGGREYQVAKATTSRHGFRFDLFEMVDDADLVAFLNRESVA